MQKIEIFRKFFFYESLIICLTVKKMEITKQQIFRYFKGDLTEQEKRELDIWIGESEEHARAFTDARIEFEYIVMHADLAQLTGTMPHAQADRKPATRTIIRICIGAAAAVAFFVLGIWTSGKLSEHVAGRELLTVSVPSGQRMSLTLGDGTTVDLNSGAELTYPAVFRGKKRNVKLEGEALFHVVHDEKKPFTVNTFAADIKVLGTEFNVNSDRSSGTFSVALVEGSVLLSNTLNPGEHIVMHPDEKVTLIKDHMILQEYEASKDAIWTEGLLDIGGLDFNRLMKKLETAFGVKIIVEKEMLPDPVFANAKLRISDGIDNALEVIRNGTEFTYTRDRESGTIIIR